MKNSQRKPAINKLNPRITLNQLTIIVSALHSNEESHWHNNKRGHCRKSKSIKVHQRPKVERAISSL